MYTFYIQPDFNKLRSFFKQYTDDQYEEFIRIYQLEGSYTTDEFKQMDAESIEVEFKKLVNKYGIGEHYDNLFYLSITNYEVMQHQFEARYRQYEEIKRSNELAKLLLLYKETAADKKIDLSAKGLTETAVVKDQLLSNWIGKLICESIEQKQFPLAQFGDSVIFSLFGTANPLQAQKLEVKRLKMSAGKRVRKPSEKAPLAQLCLSIFSYLQSHTELKAAKGTDLSDVQLNFFYDFLNVFSLLDNERIQSESKDYINSLLRNKLKKEL